MRNILAGSMLLASTALLLQATLATADTDTGTDNSKLLTLERALHIAAQQSPLVRAGDSAWRAAKQQARPADALPDPRLILGIDNLPLTGPAAYSLTADDMTMQRVGLMQDFPNAGKRKARRDQAQARIGLADNEVKNRQLIAQRETAEAWIARYTLEQQQSLITQLRKENTLLTDATHARVRGNQGNSSEWIMPKQEALQLDEMRDELQSRWQQANARLQQWLGNAADAALAGDIPSWPINREALQHNLHQHPELQTLNTRAQALDADIREARAARTPDWSLEAVYQKRQSGLDDMVSLEVRMDLPLFTRTRQNPMIAARESERQALDAEREASLREHLAMLESDYADYQRLQAAEERIQTQAMPLVEEKIALAMAAWRSNQGSLQDVINARRERLMLQLRAQELKGQRQQLAARLYFTVPENGTATKDSITADTATGDTP